MTSNWERIKSVWILFNREEIEIKKKKYPEIEMNYQTGVKNNSALVIQRAFKHFLSGRKERNKIAKKNMAFIWKLKSFQIAQFYDSSTYRFSNNRETVCRIQKSIDVWLHQDEDDDIDYSLTVNQKEIIQSVLEQKSIYKRDITLILKSLTLDQIEFLQ